MQKLLVIAAVLATCLVHADEGQGPAWLLASKQLHNQFVVEDKELIVEYSIYNVGESVAVNILLDDQTFPSQDFDVVRGLLKAKWDRIAPGTNVSHTVILRPKIFGFFNMTSAFVTYYPTEDASEPVFAYTSAPGEGGIMKYREYDRKFSPHLLDWGAFGMMTVPSLCIPFMLWYRSKSKYEAIMRQGKKSN
ncbi:PREDICTED: translocon-associated protein subunit beta-like [Priapulus caudatus]|uniref:Translocon-associated protein subunit beta n=1 Tax=Priapulus caudatus TaxID=37621 RepID=A0ABM1E4S5_PRICU|nr:PREDICTED: translocon-associated protein subunit beta-like [Priapulus caudatus]